MGSRSKSCSRGASVKRKLLLAGAAFAFTTYAMAMAIPATLAARVRQDVSFGRADAALQQLDGVLAKNPSDAEAHNLRCRVFYEEEHWDQAIADCQAAVKLDPGNSRYHLWLGRAYGQKANQLSSLVGAYRLARKVAAEFQQAVHLDPHNVAALSDLGEFDVDAPLVAGGGITRARQVLNQLRPLDPTAALVLQSRIAEEQKDYPAAEADLKAAIGESKDPAAAWMHLAAFYRRRGRITEMVASAHKGAALDRRHGPALVDGATDLAETRQDPQAAIRWLNEYLSSQAQSEAAPAFVVRARLAMLLENAGEEAAAQQQLAQVHSLASGYRIPAPNSSAGSPRGK